MDKDGEALHRDRDASRSPRRDRLQSSDNPMRTRVYSAPVMTEDEIGKVTMPLDQVSKQLKETLCKYGVAVVTGVIASEELLELESAFKQDLLDLIDVAGLHEACEGVLTAYKQFVCGGLEHFPAATASVLARSAGFLQGRGLPQGRLAWAVRRHPNVHAVFSELFPREDGELVSSLGATWFTPPGRPVVTHSCFNAHVDQNRHDVRAGLAERDVYQGAVYIWPASADGQSTTTVVWPGSHKDVWPLLMDDESFKDAGAQGEHYCEIPDMVDVERAFFFAEGWSRNARRCVVPAGALLLWNSRTVHTGWSGGPRLAQAVCLEPTRRRPEAERLAKLRLLALGLPSCHWASVGMQHDMCLGEPGSFAEHTDIRSAARQEIESGKPDQVILPLRPAIFSKALLPEADLERLRSLVKVEYRQGLVGMWGADQESAELLEASIGFDYKRFL